MDALPKDITIGKKYDPAMLITDQAEADAYFEVLVAHSMSHGFGRAEAERIERLNLGYFAGYCGTDTRRQVERLFRTAHPVFGAVGTSGVPTAQQAYDAGRKMARS